MNVVEFKRAGIVTILMVFVLIGASVNAFAQENPAIKQARQLFDNDQPTKALGVLNDAAKANAADPVLLYNLGRMQLLTGDAKSAEITFQKGIDTNPKDGLALAGKGHLRMTENNATEAKTFLDQALAATKSKNNDVLRAVGEAYLANEKTANDALTVLLKAKSNGDTNPYTYIVLGDAYAKLVKGGEAVTSFEKAASLDPKNGFPHYKMGLVYFRSKNVPVAEESLLKAVAVDPNTTLAHKELGELYYTKKEAAKAVKSYEAYLALTEKPEPAKVRYAFFLFMAKDYAKANSVFKPLSEKPDASTTVLKYYAYSLVESGNLDEASTAFDKFFAKVPKEEISADDYTYFGKMLQKGGKDSLAIINFRKSLEYDKNPDIAQIIAETFFKQKKYADAAAAYEEERKIKGKLTSKEWFDLGRAYYATRKFVNADSAFAELIIQQPTITAPYAWRGRAAAAIDSTMKQALAKPYFDKVVEIGAATPDKSKNDLIQAYEYLGYYYDTKGDFGSAKTTFEKLKAIDPANEKALAYLKALKDAAAQQKKKPAN